MIHWSSGREGHHNYRRDLVIWLVHLIYRAAGFALCYNYYVKLNYCIRFEVLPCVRLCLNSCLFVRSFVRWPFIRWFVRPLVRSSVRPFVHSFGRSFALSFALSFTHSCTLSFIQYRFIDSAICEKKTFSITAISSAWKYSEVHGNPKQNALIRNITFTFRGALAVLLDLA